VQTERVNKPGADTGAFRVSVPLRLLECPASSKGLDYVAVCFFFFQYISPGGAVWWSPRKHQLTLPPKAPGVGKGLSDGHYFGHGLGDSPCLGNRLDGPGSLRVRGAATTAPGRMISRSTGSLSPSATGGSANNLIEPGRGRCSKGAPQTGITWSTREAPIPRCTCEKYG